MQIAPGSSPESLVEGKQLAADVSKFARRADRRRTCYGVGVCGFNFYYNLCLYSGTKRGGAEAILARRTSVAFGHNLKFPIESTIRIRQTSLMLIVFRGRLTTKARRESKARARCLRTSSDWKSIARRQVSLELSMSCLRNSIQILSSEEIPPPMQLLGPIRIGWPMLWRCFPRRAPRLS